MRNSLHHTLTSIGLPLALGIGAGLCIAESRSLADHPRRASGASEAWVRLGRTLGIGWGDGYHTCQPRPERRAADLPPATYFASPAGRGDVPSHIRLPWIFPAAKSAAAGVVGPASPAEPDWEEVDPGEPLMDSPLQAVPPQPQAPQLLDSAADFSNPALRVGDSRVASLRPTRLPKPETERATPSASIASSSAGEPQPPSLSPPSLSPLSLSPLSLRPVSLPRRVWEPIEPSDASR